MRPRVWVLAVTFAELLREYRRGLGLTQEELAERAQLSARAISDLERGLKHSPRATTVRLLARALGLNEADAAQFLAVAQGRQRQLVAAEAAHITSPKATSTTELPSGTVTFLFTDLVAHTRLWEADAEAMRVALARHDAILRRAVLTHDGHVVKATGDGLHAAFARATDAVDAAIDAQRALAGEVWQLPTPLQARMGLHTGTAEQRDGDYFGLSVNRAARVMQVAHGGQVLLSLATAQLVRRELPSGTSLRDLGEHTLKDLQEPERLFQVVAPDLPEQFPPLRRNLPRQLSSFVGRERELAEIQALIKTTPLLTLVGPGGVGKTRLALEAARRVQDGFADGVWLVDLAPLTEAQLVPQAIADALGVPEHAGSAMRDTLIASLQLRHLLVVLDNCEHLVGACAEMAEGLLQGCPHLTILATSREPLRVSGETTRRVPPLSMPRTVDHELVEETLGSEAGRLFVERAQAAAADFILTARTARAVADVCRRLDGIPLAIELAAARVRSLGVEQLATRLDDRFRLLVAGVRTGPPRQRTLRAAVEWSYELLDDDERRLFALLAVFAGGWTLEAAEAVCILEGLESNDVLHLLEQLVDKSLVLAEHHDGGGRYRLLETIRQYAQERLVTSGDDLRVGACHTRFFLELAERAAPELAGPQPNAWLDLLESEHDNFRKALGRALAHSETEAALRLGRALGPFWLLRGHLSEGRRWLDDVLACSGSAPLAPRAEALVAMGELVRAQGDYAEARERYLAGLALFQDLSDRRGQARATAGLGTVARDQGDYEAARKLLGEALTLFRLLADRRGIGTSLSRLGEVARERGEYAVARTLHEEALAVFRETHDQRGISLALGQLGLVTLALGDPAGARGLLEEGLASFRVAGDRFGVARTLAHLGLVAREQADYASAEALCEQANALFGELGDRKGVGDCLHALGWIALHREQYDLARGHFEAALMQYRLQGLQRDMGRAFLGFGVIAFSQEDYSAARAQFEQALMLFRTLGTQEDIAASLAALGMVALEQGDQCDARAQYAAALVIYHKLGERMGIARCMTALAALASAQGNHAQAARLLGAAEAALPGVNPRPVPAERAQLNRQVAAARAGAREHGWLAAHNEGRTMPTERAIDAALGDQPAAEPR
jgi:predicted ATPase/class 3 adenylate cyclase